MEEDSDTDSDEEAKDLAAAKIASLETGHYGALWDWALWDTMGPAAPTSVRCVGWTLTSWRTAHW